MKLQVPRLGECGKTAVIGFFHIIRKAAGRQLFASEVILQTFAADAFAAASWITAITKVHVFILFTFHHNLLSIDLRSSQFRIQ
jgi:hypothetical protein